MEFVRGQFYQFNPKPPVPCLNCSGDMTDQVTGVHLLYIGKLDGHDYFIYDVPPKCSQCQHVLRYHVDGAAVIDVTAEFQKMLDKN